MIIQLHIVRLTALLEGLRSMTSILTLVIYEILKSRE